MNPRLPPDGTREMTTAARSVLVCHGKSCRKFGAAKVLAAFLAHPIRGVEGMAAGCLGYCGNGPMVLILPNQIWYRHLRPEEVPELCDRHFGDRRPEAGD